MTHTAKNIAFKNQLRNFLCDENHLYRIILIHLALNVALTTNHLQVAGYKIEKKITQNSNFSLTASLPDHSCKPTKQRTVTILRHNNKLTSGMCLLGFQQVYALCALSFLLSSVRLLVFFTNETILRY